MRHQLVYDLPTRFFHWFFAGLFLTAFVIAKTVDSESLVYSYHMLAGLTLGFLVILRIVWGIVGTKHARFSGYALNPKDLIQYMKGIFTGDKRRWAGHNPASSYAALTMFLLALALGVTGYLMTSGPNKETYEDIHEIFANSFIVIVVLHVAGIVFHTIRHKEMIGLSMVKGTKADVGPEGAIASARPVMGLVMLALVLAFGISIYKKFDSQTRTLQLFGSTLQLGDQDEDGEDKGTEAGAAAREGGDKGGQNQDDDDKDDD